MAQVDILIKGYNQEVSEELHKYASTTTLVRSGEFNIVVDPGTHKSTDLYVHALKDFDLTPNDITHVFTTHEHLDHTRDIPFFKNATVIDSVGYHKADEHRFDESEELEIAPGVKRMATPGHGQEDQHASLLVDTDKGVVCVAGDVWWYEDLTPVDDSYISDPEALEESRKKILELADYIIPGHGGMVKVEK